MVKKERKKERKKRGTFSRAAFRCPGASAPVQNKIRKKFRKIQKIPKKIEVVDNLMREMRPNFQNIWTYVQLSAKKTNQTKIVYKQNTFLQTSDLSFLLRAAQESKYSENWSVPHASNCPPPQKKLEFFEFV